MLILGDAKARKVAEKLHINYTGTLGLIIKSKQLGITASVRPLFERIQQTNFRFSEKVFQELLYIAGELE